jgi:8-oxo-dGTP diphosphatase
VREMEKTELMNLCMIYDGEGNVLLQNRRKKVWPGVTFPGGHVEKGESLVLSVIREIKEETGLEIRNVKLCGVKEWFDEQGERSMVFFYKTGDFSGQLHSSEEGEVFWAPLESLKEYRLANDFHRNLEMFLSDNISELFYDPEEDHVLKSY